MPRFAANLSMLFTEQDFLEYRQTANAGVKNPNRRLTHGQYHTRCRQDRA